MPETRETTSPGECTDDDVRWLRHVTESAKFIPKNVYSHIVRDSIVCCVDVIMRRPDGTILLIRRGTEPTRGYWWYIGGRMLRGETFFDAAVRKARDEAGIEATPLKVIGVWNAFYPTSEWDGPSEHTRRGTQTVNTVVLCDVDTTSLVALDSTSEEHRWVPYRDILREGEKVYDRYLVESLQMMVRRGY